MLDKIKARIIEIEDAMKNLVAQHATLSGHLTEAKYFLDMATKAAEEIAPGSPETTVLEAVDKVADACEEAVSQIAE